MGEKAEKNKVEKCTGMLRCESVSGLGLSELLSEYFKGEKAWILFWEQYRVDFAWYDGDKIHWYEDKAAEEKYLLEVRVFHDRKEGHLLYDDGKSYGRILEEVPAEEETKEQVYKKTSEVYMWGSIVKDGTIREDRGMEYHLPCSPEATNFGYQVAQYYLPDEEDGMLHMTDYRMTGIFQEITKKHKRTRDYLEIGGVL